MKLETNYFQCAICLTDYNKGEELLTLPCFHKFHSDCVEKWFKSQNWCPICRTKIVSSSEDVVGDGGGV